MQFKRLFHHHDGLLIGLLSHKYLETTNNIFVSKYVSQIFRFVTSLHYLGRSYKGLLTEAKVLWPIRIFVSKLFVHQVCPFRIICSHLLQHPHTPIFFHPKLYSSILIYSKATCEAYFHFHSFDIMRISQTGSKCHQCNEYWLTFIQLTPPLAASSQMWIRANA